MPRTTLTKARKHTGGHGRSKGRRESCEERLRFINLLLDAVEQAVIATDRKGRILHWNRCAERMYGWRAADVVGKSIADVLLPEPQRDRGREVVAALARGGESPHEWELRRRDGSMIPVRTSSRPILDDRGVLIGIVGVSWDVSENRRLEQELHQSEIRLRLVAEQLPALAWATDADLRVVWTVGSAFRGLRVDPVSLIGKTIADVVNGGGGRPEAIEAHRRALQGEIVAYEGTGRDRVFHSVVQPFRDSAGEIVGTVGASLDITDHKRVESELYKKREQVHALSGRLLVAQEAERRSLARELHDELGQFLTAIRLNLEGARSAGANLRAQQITECITLVDQAIDQARRLALDLRPAILDDLGLVAALRSLLKSQSAQVGFEGRFAVAALDARLSTALETCAFRLVQEALTNVARHAGAKTVDVEVGTAHGELRILVRDDGKGFDVPSARLAAVRGASLGLLSMMERVALCGGRLEITSALGKGTSLDARLPLAWQEEA
jgi:PAS domain S-box-containing protein